MSYFRRSDWCSFNSTTSLHSIAVDGNMYSNYSYGCFFADFLEMETCIWMTTSNHFNRLLKSGFNVWKVKVKKLFKALKTNKKNNNLEVRIGHTSRNLFEQWLLDFLELRRLNDIQNLLHFTQEHHLIGWDVQSVKQCEELVDSYHKYTVYFIEMIPLSGCRF